MAAPTGNNIHTPLDTPAGEEPVHSYLGSIDNPFRRLQDLRGLNRLGESFARKVDKKFPNNELFRKAARIAYDPPSWRQAGITDDEAEAYRRGREASFWGQSRPLQVTVVALCFSAITQGFCQSILNGSNVTMPDAFGLRDQDGIWNGKSSLFIFSGLNAIVYLSAGLCGCWIADPLQSKYLGRRYAILVSACICFASIVGASFTTNWKQLMACRALLGCGLGAKASVTPIFCAEASPSHLRGALVINWQLYDAFGIFLGFSSGLALSSTGILSWRFQTASACIPTCALILLIWTVPESPRWLLKKERYGDAFASMCALRHSQLEAAVELLYANEQIQEETRHFPQGSQSAVDRDGGADHSSRFQKAVAETSYWMRICQLFKDERTRRATVAAGVVMICQQLCGINVLCFYGTTFFSTEITGGGSNSTSMDALWMSWGIGLVNVVFCFPAYFWIDPRGRRFLLLVTYPGMILAMFAACLSFLVHDEKWRFALVSTFMFIFVVFYSFGQGPVAFAYASEVFPLFNREAGMSFSVFINLTGAGILTLLVPQAQVTPGSSDSNGSAWQRVQITLLAVFTILNVVAFVLIFCFVPDTAGATIRKEENQMNYMSLEELNYIFEVKTWKHAKKGWRRLKRVFGFEDNTVSQIAFEFPEGNIFGEKDRATSGNPLLHRQYSEDIAPDEGVSKEVISKKFTEGKGTELRSHVGDVPNGEVRGNYDATEEATTNQIEAENDAARDGSTTERSLLNDSNREIIIEYLSTVIEGLRQRR